MWQRLKLFIFGECRECADLRRERENLAKMTGALARELSMVQEEAARLRSLVGKQRTRN